jgi:predicted chitinase
MINRKLFYEKLKVNLFTKFTQLQVDGIEAILNEIEAQGVTDPLHQAYIFATAYHEAYDVKNKLRIVPIIESGGPRYLRSKKYFPFYGRGYVQLTWGYNYKKYSDLLKIDLIKNPDKVLDVKISAFILVHGMRTGSFTGKKLSNYKTFAPMRRIINGIDKASLIASIANHFLVAISNS